MEEHYNINIKRAEDTSALKDFVCGVPSMDSFIQDQENGLSKFIKLRLSNLWIVYEGDKIVAFFALSKDAIILNNEDRRNIESNTSHQGAIAAPEDEDMFWGKEKYPAIEIDYFAVCKEKRELNSDHLGTYIINLIAQKALLDPFPSTLFLTVDALDTKEYSAVDFYRSCDFEYSDVAQNKYNYDSMYGNQPTTRRMYKLIIPLD